MNENSKNHESFTEVPKNSFIEISLENADGSFSKIMEFDPLSTGQKYEISDQKDSVTLPLNYRIQTFAAATVNLHAPLKLNRDTIRKMAQELGLFDSE